ncbi:hypothetical protein [Bartonella sp. CB178]|uniref:hypothetical protein n=1 Tax=Bartonella sp. CB178 TaxID=3112255 RepID=UPI00300E2696
MEQITLENILNEEASPTRANGVAFPSLDLRKCSMSALIFVLILVSCTDDFNSCYSDSTMVKTYPTAQECEQALMPSIQKFLHFGEQIFAQCTSVHANSREEEVSITWSVTNRGNLLINKQQTKTASPTRIAQRTLFPS